MREQTTTPVREIDADNLEEFFRKAESLPDHPIGDGHCQLIRKQHGERLLPICAGHCERGDCYTRFKLGPGDRIRVWCECA